MNILSLFDGMCCGMLAFQSAGVPVNSYTAYEIDKYAIQTTQHNFPEVKECGDIFEGDFTQYKGIDWLIGGSVCTFWSICQKPDKRETIAEGIGWDLFMQYVRALKEAKPKYFLYENNKSMSDEIRKSISDQFGFESIHIDSALVTAQKRDRLYWVGKRNNDGTYSKVDIKQPNDKGFILKDILEHGLVDREKAYCLKHQAGNTRDYFKKHHTQIAFEPIRIGDVGTNSQAHRVYSCMGKSITLKANGGGQGGKTGLYMVPIPDELIKSVCDKGKVYTIKDNIIDTKFGGFKVDLPDGYYIIRKLTVLECKRLQTVPDWYEFPVSDTQAYKMLGSGWSVEVIAHLIKSTLLAENTQ